MSGETVTLARASAPRQPGGREPAPGQLALVQAFINSHFDIEAHKGADLFASPQGLRDWLLARDLIGVDDQVGTADLTNALTVRESLRALAAGSSDGIATAALNTAATGAAVEVRFTRNGPRFVPHEPSTTANALGLILALVAEAMIDGTWSRLKICPGDHCGWAFFDNSRNQTGRWCSMSLCGGRSKARAHYRRTRGGGD